MLIRVIEFLVGLMFVLSVVRSLIGMVTKVTGQPDTSQQRAGNSSRPQTSSASTVGGELKKDPVCGFYLPRYSLPEIHRRTDALLLFHRVSR